MEVSLPSKVQYATKPLERFKTYGGALMTAARTDGMATMTKTAEKIRKKDDRIVGIIHLFLLDKFFGFGSI
jgi:hypothetical protein